MTAPSALVFRTWGGRRDGAGRKPVGPKTGVPHCCRRKHQAPHPLHVTLRATRGCQSLRSSHLFPTLRSAIAKASTDVFRVAQFSVQTNHVHLIIETADEGTLGRGMQGLAIRLAKAVNRLSRRRGRVWAERYHSRALRTPKEVRHALAYVLLNGRKHQVCGVGIDPCSSGRWFDGWGGRVALSSERRPVARAESWLLRLGWRRHGLICLGESPGGGRKRLRPWTAFRLSALARVARV